MPAPRRFRYGYREACAIAGVLELDVGDIVELDWRGEWAKPELRGHGRDAGRRAIVVDVELDALGFARELVVSLVDEGRDAGDVAELEPADVAGSG